VMGGDEIFATLKDHLDVGNDETTDDGKVTLEHLECNAACDYAPVMMVNWEFMDNQTPESAVRLVDDLRAGAEVHSTRGPRLCTWREAERVLAGFPDGLAGDGPAAGPASLAGLAIARERGWTAPVAESGTAAIDGDGDAAPAVPSEPEEKRQATAESGDSTAKQATAEEQSPTTETGAEKKEAD
jgi:NADH-quinone oxidoreductase subunit E